MITQLKVKVKFGLGLPEINSGMEIFQSGKTSWLGAKMAMEGQDFGLLEINISRLATN